MINEANYDPQKEKRIFEELVLIDNEIKKVKIEIV